MLLSKVILPLQWCHQHRCFFSLSNLHSLIWMEWKICLTMYVDRSIREEMRLRNSKYSKLTWIIGPVNDLNSSPIANEIWKHLYLVLYANLKKTWRTSPHITTMISLVRGTISQSESTLYVKELLPRNKRSTWSLSDTNEIQTYNHLFRKRTLNQMVKFGKPNLPKWLSVCLRTKWLWVPILLLSLNNISN